MRSRTDLSRLPRCPRCFLPPARCLCAEVTRFDPGLEIVIVRHALEIPKSTNTARIAALALDRCTIHDYGLKDARFDPDVIDRDGAALLFPGGSGTPAEVKRLVVIDGTWPQTKAMFAKIRALHRLPRVSLDVPVVAPVRLRHHEDPSRLGTLEAIVGALRVLGRDDAASKLDAVRVLHVKRILASRGRRHPHVTVDDEGLESP